MKSLKQYIALFYLVIFIGIKFIGLHTFTHSDFELDNDCEICEYAVTSNKVPFVATSDTLIEAPIQHCFKTQYTPSYKFQFTAVQIDNSLFGRPPPFI